jgi:hypothetical protein
VRPGRRAALAAAALLLAVGAAPACELVLAAHPEGSELARATLDPAEPALRVAFIHSVLGTPVEDHYRFRPGPEGWRAHLVAERFQGDGYGLPHAAGPGERLQRDGEGWRLDTDRVVHPLVVRALAAQQMRVLLPGREPLGLATLGAPAVALRAEHCPNPRDPA